MLFEDTGLLIGWVICTWAIITVFTAVEAAFKKTNDELAIKLTKHLDSIIHRVRVEKDRDTYYWYDMDNNKFLGQGSTDEEIINSLKSRFPTHMFFLPTNHIICAKTDWQPKQVGK